MFSLSGSMELAQQRGISHSPVPLLQAAPSFLLLLSETWKEKQSALCWVEGNVLFNQKGRFFFFFFFFFYFTGKTWSNAISILPRPILGGSGGAEGWCGMLPFCRRSCSVPPSPGLWLTSAWFGVPAASPAQCPLCPPSPSPPPCCVGDAPSGCGQRFLLL